MAKNAREYSVLFAFKKYKKNTPAHFAPGWIWKVFLKFL